jgi:electron transport complex protein RnfC
MAKTFRGGARPGEAKTATSGKAIAETAPPSRVVIPLSQHTGSPARPIVKAGDAVKVGTKIAEGDGFVSAPVHASVSGIVRSVGEFPHPLGRTLPAIEIENDGKDEWVDLGSWRDLAGADPQTVRDAVREAGIVGLGGAAFPTHVKLTPPPGKRISTVILNGTECEPYLTADYRIMMEHAPDVIGGLEVMMRAVGAERGLVAVESNKPEAAASMSEAAGGKSGIDVCELKPKYPQGSEKLLIKALTGREMPRGGLPADVECLVQNVGTSLAVYEALRWGRPLVRRVITLTGSAALAPANLRVRIGTSFAHVIASSGGARDDCAKLLMGGPMMGIAEATAEVPVVKATTGITLIRERDVCPDEAGPCIRCGRCVDRCPVGLVPNEIARCVEKGKLEWAVSYGLNDCIECGVCAYVCPAKIAHVHWVKQGKAVLAAEQARERQQ